MLGNFNHYICFIGVVTYALPIQTGKTKDGRSWKKQDIIINYDESHPKEVCVSLWGDMVNEMLMEGYKVKVSVNVESKEYRGKWYTEVKAWKLEHLGIAEPSYF